ncbi:hypothetical protein [Yersinia intermedia]|uniref:hypothetical protein n=1 Tax=Yersinia intermedia TaxID=631 RepID=UPI00164154A6|nr:hypothetical protein [Yersinia intermedia]
MLQNISSPSVLQFSVNNPQKVRQLDVIIVPHVIRLQLQEVGRQNVDVIIPACWPGLSNRWPEAFDPRTRRSRARQEVRHTGAEEGKEHDSAPAAGALASALTERTLALQAIRRHRLPHTFFFRYRQYLVRERSFTQVIQALPGHGRVLDTFTDSGITDAEQLEITAAPGVLRLQRREVGAFEA